MYEYLGTIQGKCINGSSLLALHRYISIASKYYCAIVYSLRVHYKYTVRKGSQNSRERVSLLHSARTKLSKQSGQFEENCGQRGWRLAQEHSAIGMRVLVLCTYT